MDYLNDKPVYVQFDEVDPEDVKVILNRKPVREHLVDHELFDSNSVKTWIKEKIKVDSKNGCRVRGIISRGHFAGWCGIQVDNEDYEIAIVLDAEHWGIGKKVFLDVMSWAKELGHEDIYIHLLETRRRTSVRKNKNR